MGYIILGIVLGIVFLLLVGVILYYKLKENSKKVSKEKRNEFINQSLVKVEEIEESSIPKTAKLVEITDKKILNGISKITPSFVSAGKAVSSTQATSLVYRAVIPAGATLAKTSNLASVTNTVGNVAYINQASTTSALIGSAQAFGAVASVMAVASIIVGQYYMMQINSNLKELNLGISNIISFQNAEYRSRVMSLISHIKTLADFQVENLNEEELRNSALIELSTLENECTKLLGQAGEAINNIIDKDYDDFPLYEKEVEEIQRWSTYQETLFSLLDRIADLKYVFHLGKMSREQCDSLVDSYSKQIDEMKVRLIQLQRLLLIAL